MGIPETSDREMSRLDQVALNHNTIDQLNMAEAYLKDLLPESQRMQFSAHLAECDECMDRIRLAQMWLLAIPTEATEASRKSATLSNESTHLDPVSTEMGVTTDFSSPQDVFPPAEMPTDPASSEAPVSSEAPLSGDGPVLRYWSATGHAEGEIHADEWLVRHEPARDARELSRESSRELSRESQRGPMVTRVNVQFSQGKSVGASAPESAAPSFGEMLAKRMAAEAAAPAVAETSKPTAMTRPMIPSRLPQFATWQLDA